MSEETATIICVGELIPLLCSIYIRKWNDFLEREAKFVEKYGVEVWEEFFATRLKPALDKDSDRWLLAQWCETGIVSVKDVA
ncbi:MAG: hypothetical protein AAGG00_09270 [Cyanobacteria bacterium P01_H01_bin.150]